MFTLIAVVLPVRSQLTSDSNTFNSKGKQKVITFKDADKIVIGYVDNKEFVSGQYVDIYNYHFNTKEKYDVYIENGLLVVKHGKETMSITPFLSGTYHEDSYMPYIKGKLYNGNVSIKGQYGSKYGSLLAQGKIAIGMTSKMIAEIYPTGLYKISQLTSGGRDKEVWTFNRQLVNGSALLGQTYGLVDGMGYNAPKRMVFIRGRLTDIIR